MDSTLKIRHRKFSSRLRQLVLRSEALLRRVARTLWLAMGVNGGIVKTFASLVVSAIQATAGSAIRRGGYPAVSVFATLRRDMCRGVRFTVLIAGILLGVLDLGAVTEREIYRVLEERHIPFDTNAVQRSAVEAIIKAIDPRAKILSREDAAKLVRGDTIEKAEEWPEGICYLKLNGLYEGGGDKVTQRLKTWAEAGQSGVIVDIRGAGGNSLSAIDEIAGLFIPGNTVLYKIKDCRDRVVETHKTKEASPLNNIISCRYDMMPLMLIIDDETRDASEVMASVLKRRRGLMLIGAPTKGDSNLREVIPLSGDEVLYVSIRQIVLPDVASYSPDGVQPDIAVSKTVEEKKNGQPSQDIVGEGRGRPLSDKAKMDRELVSHVTGDAVLGRAVDILLGLKALAEPEVRSQKSEVRGQKMEFEIWDSNDENSKRKK